MQEETFVDVIASRLQSKDSPLYKNTLILFQTIDSNISSSHKTNEQIHKKQFFVSLLTLIQNQVKNRNHDHIDSAFLLMNWIIPLVQRGFVLALNETIVQCCQEIMSSSVQVNPLINKFCVGILGQIIDSTTSQSLNDNIIESSFRCILWQAASNQKAIRKQAVKTVKSLLDTRQFEVFGSQTQHFKSALSNFFQVNILELNESAQYAVTLLSQIYRTIPFTILGDSIQHIIRQIEIGDIELMPHLFLTLETILIDRQVNQETVEKIITQMLQVQTDIKQPVVCHAFLQCLRQCIIALVTTSKHTGGQYLPSVVSTMIEYLLQDNGKLQKLATSEIMKVIQAAGATVLEKCQDTGVNEDLMMLELDDSQAGVTLIQKYLMIIQYLLSSRFESVYQYVIEIVEQFFSTLKPQTLPLVITFVKKFVDFNKNRPKKDLFEKCFGSLVNVVHLGQLIELYPINIFAVEPLNMKFEELSNCWLLRIISRHAVHVDFDQYLTHLFPILVQAIQSYQQFSEGQQKVMLCIIMQLFQTLEKSKITEQNILYPGLFKQAASDLLNLIESLIDDKLPFYSYLIRAAEKAIPQLAYSDITSKKVQEKAQSMISSLAKLVVSGDERCRPSLNLIRILTFHTSQDYLNKAVDRNIDKILEISQRKQSDQLALGLKNMDILVQVIPAFKFKNDTWSKCMSFVDTLMKEKNTFQKKAYKFITEIIGKVHYTFLEEVAMLVVENSKQVQPFSRQKRFQVLQLLLDKQFGTQDGEESRYTIYEFQTFIQNFLPEIVVAVRDSNIKTRQVVIKVLESIGNKLIDIQHLEAFISMILAGLGATSSLMKSDAIATVSILVELFLPQLSGSFLREITSLIVLMVREKNNEIYKSVINYFKHLSKAHKKFKVTEFIGFKEHLNDLFELDVLGREKNIIAIKRLVMRFIKAYGLSYVEEAFPIKHLKLIRNIKRVDKRTKKNKNKHKHTYEEQIDELAQKLGKKKRVQKKTKEVLSDDDNEDEQPIKTNNKGGMEEEQGPPVDNNLLLKYDFNKEKFHFTEDVRQKKLQIQKQREDDTFKDVEFKNGKVIVKEEKLNLTGVKRRRENRDVDETGEEKKGPQEQVKKIKAQKGTKVETLHVVRESGEMFRPKSRAGGDIQVKGRPEPFAFIQLNPKVLNKRFRAQAQKAFDQVLLSKKPNSSLKGLKSVKN